MNDSLRDTLQELNQTHLITACEKLDAADRQLLEEQIAQIPWDEMRNLIPQALAGTATESLPEIQPLENAIRLPESQDEITSWAQAREAGLALLDAGRVGAILVAGGQGTRLGFPHPKGMFPIGPVTSRTLFQIFFEQLLALSNRHGVRIPYFIMTSDATHDETEQFLSEHAWFGYPPEDVYLFRQGTMPAIDDNTGQILLASPTQVAISPDGHGGLLNALQRANLFQSMKHHGVETLFYHQVDNPCVTMCDPVMLGFHSLRNSEITTKVVAKRNAAERVGILAQMNQRQAIVEYSDLPLELSEKTDSSGMLVYWAGNIAIHVMNRDLLERLATGTTRLPIHIAHKKVPYLNSESRVIEPEAPNAFKFERFVFDAIPLAQNPLVIETSREDEFNPVKNAEGEDSPASSKQALSRRGQRWLQQAGYDVAENTVVEISPLEALEPADLQDMDLNLDGDADEILLIPDSQ
ncbi:MAG: UDPGP type 1 family protein [Planctomycetaceae bacterium]|nr:UDPGP type 1 family protein [Planctomycetaceae bacterium]